MDALQRLPCHACGTTTGDMKVFVAPDNWLLPAPIHRLGSRRILYGLCPEHLPDVKAYHAMLDEKYRLRNETPTSVPARVEQCDSGENTCP